MGLDGINAVYSVIYEMDKKNGTDYMERFKKWLTYIQDENLMVVGAMTDPKGDRSKARPINPTRINMFTSSTGPTRGLRFGGQSFT